MPRKAVVTATGGQQPARSRQRKKKEPVNQEMKMDMSQPMGYEHPGISNGIMVDECNAFGQHEFYYQQGGPTSTASSSMNNSYGPPSQSQGHPGSAPLNQSYPDNTDNPQQPQHMPQYNIPVSSQAPSGMMSQHPGPHPQGPPNNVNPALQPPQMMMRPMIPMLPQPPLLEYRLMEMNRRIYSFNHQEYPISAHDRGQWWEAFGQEFFDDEARFTLTAYESPDQIKRYSVGKQLIPKFFRHLFDTGVDELYFVPRGLTTERTNQWGALAMECESVAMVTTIKQPVPARIQTDAKLFIEFSPFEELYGYRIRNFHIELKNTQEFISRQLVNQEKTVDNETQEKLKQGLSKYGFTVKALNFLKLCVIMEPMQVIMQHCKAHPNVTPREALKTLLFNQYQQKKPVQMTAGMPPMNMLPSQPVMPPQPPVEESKKPARKRTRKNNTAPGATTPAKQRKGQNRASPPQQPTNFPVNQNYNQYQEVLVVGEPSLMGGDFGEDDERSISRIENTQFDGSINQQSTNNMPGSAPMSVGLPTNGSTPMYSRQNSFNRSIDGQKIQQPQSVPIARVSSQSHLGMNQPAPAYESPMSNPQWNGMNQSNNTLIAQTICDQ